MKRLLSHVILISLVILLFMPLYLALVAASHDASAMLQKPLPFWPGWSLISNIKIVLTQGLLEMGGEPVWKMLLHSFIMATLIAGGKLILALFSAFSLVYFTIPLKKYFFALIFITIMLPVEVRIIPTFQIIAAFNWLNSYLGLSIPLMTSATATFLLRQFFKTVPSELVDAAILDGAGPLRFFVDILLPLSKMQIAALFTVLFVYGWNQYLWPLVISTNNKMTTIMMGIRYLVGVADEIPQWHYIMAITLIALLPPCLVVLLMQNWFEKGFFH